jgi:hypothetical protein
VLAINQVRGLRPSDGTLHLEPLAKVVAGFSAGERDAFAELVAGSGANETMRGFLDLCGVSPVPGVVATNRELDDWRVLVTTQYAPSSEWMVALRRTPAWCWPALAWRAFWMTEEEVRLVEPDAPPGRWGLMRARVHRSWRGIRGLGAAFRVVVLRRDR